jgi:hypothetical protein
MVILLLLIVLMVPTRLVPLLLVTNVLLVTFAHRRSNQRWKSASAVLTLSTTTRSPATFAKLVSCAKVSQESLAQLTSTLTQDGATVNLLLKVTTWRQEMLNQPSQHV